MRRFPHACIFLTILLDATGLCILSPVFPDIVRRFSSSPIPLSKSLGVFLGVYSLMQVFASPVLGALSDRFGRKPILLVSLSGAAIDYLFMAFSPTYEFLLAGRLISGFTGAGFTVACAFIADTSKPSNRSANFGLIGAAWGIAFVVGPLIGGYLSQLGPIAPFIASAVFNAVNLLFVFFFLPESLPARNRRTVEFAKLNPFASMIRFLKPSPFAIFIWIYFLVYLAGQVHGVNWALYTESKFGWTAWNIGLSLSFMGLAMALSQGVLTRILIPRIGEINALTLGIGGQVSAFFLFSVANQGWMMYGVMVLFALSVVGTPALMSIISSKVPADQQGELQGSLISLGSLASLLAPLIYTELFVEFTKPESVYFPGAAYLGAAMICMAAFALDLKVLRRR